MKYLKYLLLFIPISIALELFHASDVLIFITAALAIIPLAGLMGEATESLAAISGPRLGGFLNATFGNATELIIAIFAIKAGYFEVAKASIAGAIIGNILLVLGASMLLGGLKYKVQKFNEKNSGNSASLLIFAVIGLAVPAIFLHSVNSELLNTQYEILSIVISAVMITIYLLGLIFTFFTHKDILGAEHSEEIHVRWGKTKSILVLLAATALVAMESEFLVGSIEGMSSQLGWNEMFIGIIVLAIIGNAAEHTTAVVMALKNQMDIALEIAIGSSLQVVLFVAPALVFLSLLFGKPMSLIFNMFELAGISAAVMIANIVSHDGESNWLEGAQLIAVYIILAVSFFYIPLK